MTTLDAFHSELPKKERLHDPARRQKRGTPRSLQLYFEREQARHRKACAKYSLSPRITIGFSSALLSKWFPPAAWWVVECIARFV